MHPMLNEMDGLLDKARGVSIDGDRVPLFIRAEMRFKGGKNGIAPMVFNIPAGEDFFATRLNLYLASRLVNILNPDTQSELTARATDWTSVDEYVQGVSLPSGSNNSGTYQNKYANCFFEIRPDGGRKFQNAPLSILHAFSDREPLPWYSNVMLLAPPVASNVFYMDLPPYAAYIGGMDFDVEERLAAATAWNVIITPTFSRDTSAQSVDDREFTVIGILTGHKKIKPRSYER